MPLMNLAGLFASSESSRVYVTLVFVVSAFFEMKKRPVLVAAHNVAVSERGARDRRHVPAGTSGPAVVCSASCQIGCASGADADEITTGRVSAGGRELRAVRFEERLIASPILGPPNAQGALEDCSSGGRIRIAMMGE